MRIVVGVLRGGQSPEYDVSLKTGAAVLGALNKEKYEARDVFIDRGGQWHVQGVPVPPERALRGVDVAFNALHGHYGEDGTVQRLMDSLGVRYTGSGAHPSATAFNKHRTRQAMLALGVKIPHGVVVDAQKITDIEATARNLFRSLPHPSIVKPVSGGSSMGVGVADNYHALVWALQNAFAHGYKVLVEEHIPGRAAAVGVVDNFRGEEVYGLIPTGAGFTHEQKDQLVSLARQAHRGLGLAHYSVVHFTVAPRGMYFAGIEALPELHEDSALVQSLAAVGAPLPQFIDHVVALARR